MVRRWILVMILLLLIPAACCQAEQESAGEDEWTVLFYLCGSDLESEYSYATGNLEDIATCKEPINALAQMIDPNDPILEELTLTDPGKVNVLIETGGAKAWHAEKLGMEIRTDRLQRWQAHPGTGDQERGTFDCLGELPLVSMADPGTLADFIRWGAETCPAKKYALVLWDHGGGSKTGIFIDELFANDVMYLDELKQAMAEGGVRMETVLFDACLMANLETACAIREWANWMVASEEMVAGKGTAISSWLQQLYWLPNCDGEQLGRWICDMTQVKYVNEGKEQFQTLLTWSVIDLSKIEAVATRFDAFFRIMDYAYERYPELVSRYARCLYRTEGFGSSLENMWDLTGIFYQELFNNSVEVNHRKMLMDAVTDAVVYNVRGDGRIGASGLSFCYAADFYPEELDIYARNCPSPYYLAMLDAISPWTAPDWVYEIANRLPEISELDEYRIEIQRKVYQDGTPMFFVPAESRKNIGYVFYHLYKISEKTGKPVSLGFAPAYYDKKEEAYRVYDLWLWPAIDGVLCQMNVLGIPRNGTYDCLFNIPILIDGIVWNLRSSYITSRDEYEVYGLWEGFDSDSELFNRNVKALSQMAGQEFRILYETDVKNKNPRKSIDKVEKFETGEAMTMYRGLSVKEISLPEGTYFMEYVVYDNFMRYITLDRVQIDWDGQKMRMNEEDWNGTSMLDLNRYYEAHKGEAEELKK